MDDANEQQKYDEGENSLNDDSQGDIDERLNNNIERLVHKSKKDTSYGEPQVGFDEYASNRQDWPTFLTDLVNKLKIQIQ